ncbi:MAG TPA: hypothetical protein VFR37_12020 [Longimicrobium sp.]|nr:hypothetical protein [Longimicrobium sp.]
MKGLLVTIVDVFGILVPGSLILCALLAFPPVAEELLDGSAEWASGLKLVDPVITYTIGAILACAIGFINRLWAVRLCQFLTSRVWVHKLEARARNLNSSIARYLKDDDLEGDLCKVAESLEPLEVGRHATYFHYAKRLVRGSSPALWAEAERLEAEIRFTAGLLLPFTLLTIDGIYAAISTASLLAGGFALVAFAGAAAALSAFPSRRLREVLYVYLMAIIVLKHEQVRAAPVDNSSS